MVLTLSKPGNFSLLNEMRNSDHERVSKLKIDDGENSVILLVGVKDIDKIRRLKAALQTIEDFLAY